MTAATKSAPAGAADDSLEQVKQRFALWRSERKRGEHITSALWGAAVGMAQRYGSRQTARELGIDHDRLSERLERGAAAAQTGQREVRFVELFAPPVSSAAPAGACIVEMDNARGGKMRVELGSLDGLADLCSAFWRAR